MTIPIQLAIQGGGAKITYLVAALREQTAQRPEGAVGLTYLAEGTYKLTPKYSREPCSE